MLPELKALEPQLKQILYNCVEQVKATKAALYLSSSADLSAKTFELVTSYQYNPADRKIINSNDDLVDRLSVKRSPFYINGLAADQKFAEMQFRQGTEAFRNIHYPIAVLVNPKQLLHLQKEAYYWKLPPPVFFFYSCQIAFFYFVYVRFQDINPLVTVE